MQKELIIDIEFLSSKNYVIRNLVIHSLEIGFTNIHSEVTIENCIIDRMEIHSTWFQRGLILNGNIIKNKIDYQMGGHNHSPIRIENNIFENFFNFFDCQFYDQVFVLNNIFKGDTNLLGNINEGYKNTFRSGMINNNNLGDLHSNKYL